MIEKGDRERFETTDMPVPQTLLQYSVPQDHSEREPRKRRAAGLNACGSRFFVRCYDSFIRLLRKKC